MGKNTKIVQVVIVDGEPEQLKALQEKLSTIKKKLPFDAEFLITNDKIRFQDVRTMIKELIKLYNLGEDKNVKE